MTAARCRSIAWSLIRLAGLVRHVSVERRGLGNGATTVASAGSTACQAAASGVETARSGIEVFGSSEVVRPRVQPASVVTQSAAAG